LGGGEPDGVDDGGADNAGEVFLFVAHLHHYDQVFLPAARGTEGDAPAGRHTGGALHRLLDVLGVVLEAEGDDDLARPARHEQLAVGHVAEVAHAEPIAEEPAVPRCVYVAVRDPCAAHPHLSLVAFLLARARRAAAHAEDGPTV
jgi:hypothetical protein